MIEAIIISAVTSILAGAIGGGVTTLISVRVIEAKFQMHLDHDNRRFDQLQASIDNAHDRIDNVVAIKRAK